MKRRALIAAYWLVAVVCGGHASNEVYRDARLSGRSLEDAMLVGAIAGVGASIGWPVYLSAKAWGGDMSVEPKAEHFLRMAAEEMADRAKVRDAPQGERSMDRTVRAFWALYGDGILARGYMTETEGWQFMSLLKKARGAQGEFRADDHVDDVAYAALAGESAVRVSSSATRSQLSAREWGTQEPSEQIMRESYGGTD